MELARQRKLAITAYFVYLAAFYMILIFEIEPILSHVSVFGLIGNLLTFPMYRTGLRVHPGERRWPWIFFAMTGACYFMGELLWAYNATFLGKPPDVISLCNAFYLANSYMCCCAFVCYMQQIENLDFARVFFDICISVIAIGDLLYRFIIMPLLRDNSVSLAEMAMHANMSVIDLALFAGILIIIFGTARKRFSTRRTMLLGLSFFCCCFVEQLSLAITVYELPHAELFDPLWTLPFWLFALTSMYPDEDETDEAEVEAFHQRWGGLLNRTCRWLPYILAAVMLLLLGPGAATRDPALFCVLIFVAFRVFKRLSAGAVEQKEAACE
ncbi:MAG: hypothetical protein IJU05_02710 [Schwartzia sp.]|nr:hypothetical protein [Schwartzia sp. (in: firmicutes)]